MLQHVNSATRIIPRGHPRPRLVPCCRLSSSSAPQASMADITRAVMEGFGLTEDDVAPGAALSQSQGCTACHAASMCVQLLAPP